MKRPLGRSHAAITWPTGSSSRAISRMPAAMAATRFSSSIRRSSRAVDRPAALPASMSRALASRMSGVLASNASAMARSAAFFRSVVATASGLAAARARAPSSFIRVAMSAPSCTFSIDSLHLAHPFTSRRRKDQIVAVHHGRARLIAEHCGYLAGLEPRDLYGIAGVIGNQPAPRLGAVRPDNGNGIATRKRAPHRLHTGRQQAFAGPQRPQRACIDDDATRRLELARDPSLVGARRRGTRAEKRCARAALNRRYRARFLARGDDHRRAGGRGDPARIELGAHAAARKL